MAGSVGGLTFELNNFDRFKSELGSLTAVISEINAALKSTKTVANKIEPELNSALNLFKELSKQLQSLDFTKTANFDSFKGNILKSLGGLESEALEAGRDIGLSFVEGITDVLDSYGEKAVIDSAKKLAQKLKNTISSELEISSPSKFMIEIGKFLVQGLVKGIEVGLPLVFNIAKKIGSAIKDSFNKRALPSDQFDDLLNIFKDSGQLKREAGNIVGSGDVIGKAINELRQVIKDATILSRDMKELNASALKGAVGAMRDLIAFMKELDVFTQALPGEVPSGADYPLETFKKIRLLIVEVKSIIGTMDLGKLKDFKAFSQLGEILRIALSSLDTIRDPKNLATVSSGLKAFMSFLKDMGSMVTDNKLGIDAKFSNFVNKVRRALKNFPKLTMSIANALSAFDVIRNPSGIKKAAEGMRIILDILPQMMEKVREFFDRSILDRIFKQDPKAKLMKMKDIFRIVAEAASELTKIHFPVNPNSISGLLSGAIAFIDDAIRILPKITKATGFFGMSVGVTKEFSAIVKVFKEIAKALSQFGRVRMDAPKLEGIGKSLDSIGKLIATLNEKVLLGRTRFEIKKFLTPIAKNIKNAFNEFAGIREIDSVVKVSEAFRELALGLQRLQNVVNVGRLVDEIGDELPRLFKFISQGFKNADKGEMESTGESQGRDYIAGFEKALGIRSPSRVMMRIGQFAIEGFINGVKSSIGALVGIAGNAVKAFKDKFANIGSDLRNMGSNLFGAGRNLAIGGGIASFLASTQVGMAANFDQILNQVRIFGNLSQKELSNVSDEILKFSAKTIFDPTQSVSAFLELQKAGLSAADALQTLNATGDLAAAGGLELTASTEGMVRALQTFNIPVTEATSVSDAFAQAANLSTASVTDLMEGIGNVGPIAKMFGLDLEETLAVLSMFNDAGIVGAEAGTQLKSMLTNLTRASKETKEVFAELGVSLTDSAGNFRPLNDIINDLNKAMFDTKKVTVSVMSGMSAEQKTLLNEAQNAYTAASRQIMLYENGLSTATEATIANKREILANAESVIAGITGSQTEVARFTSEVQRSQEENFQAIQKLAGSFGQSGLSILLGQDEDAINRFVEQMGELPGASNIASEMMNTFKGAIESLRGSIDTLLIKALIPVMNKGLKPIINVMISAVNAISGLPQELLAVGAGAFILVSALTTLVGVGLILISGVIYPLGIAFSGLAAVLGAIAFVFTNPLGLIAGVGLFGGGLVLLTATLLAVTGAIAGAAGAIYLFVDSARKNEDVVNGFKSVKESVGGLLATIKDFIGAWINLISKFDIGSSSAAGTHSSFKPLVDLFQKIKDKADSLANSIKQVTEFINILSDVYAEMRGENDNLPSDRFASQKEDLQKQIDAIKAEGGVSVPFSIEVESGDTLTKIAKEYGTSVEAILAANKDITNPNLIRTGQEIIIPGLTATNDELGKLEKELEKVTERERLFNEQAEAMGFETQEKRMSKLQSRIEAFSKTDLGKTIFDAFGLNNKVTIDDFVQRIGEIESTFRRIGGYLGTLKSGIVDIFSGNFSKGVDKSALSLQRLAGQATNLIEQTTGIDISDQLQYILNEGDTELLKRYIFAKIKDFVRSAASEIISVVGDIGGKALDLFAKTFSRVGLNILEKIGLGEKELKPIKKLLDDLGNTFSKTFGEIKKSLKGIDTEKIKAIFEAIAPVALKAVAIGIGSTIAIIVAGINGFLSVIPPFVQVFNGFVDLIYGLVTLDFDSVGDGLRKIISGIASAPLAFIGGVGKVLGNVFDAIGQPQLAAKVERTAEGISKFAKQVMGLGTDEGWKNFTSGVSEFFGKIDVGDLASKWGNSAKEGITGLWNGIRDSLSGVTPQDILDKAGDIGEGIIDGIKSIFSSKTVEAVDEFFDKLVSGIKDKLGISSPSTVFIGIGEDIVNGLKTGISNLIGSAADILTAPFKFGFKLAVAAWNFIKSGFDMAKGLIESADWSGIKDTVINIILKVFKFGSGTLTSGVEMATDLFNFLSSAFASVVAFIQNNADVGGIVSGVKNYITGTVFSLGDKIFDTAEKVKNFVTSVFSSAVGLLSSVVDPGGIVESVKEKISEIFDELRPGVGNAGLKVKDFIVDAFGRAILFISPTNENIVGLKDKVIDFAKSSFEFGGDLAGELGGKIKDVVTGGFSQATSLITGLASDPTIASVKTEIENLISGIMGSINSLQNIDVNTLVQPIKDFLGGINDAVKGFDLGVLKDVWDGIKGFGADLGLWGGDEDDKKEEVAQAINDLGAQFASAGASFDFQLPEGFTINEEDAELLRTIGQTMMGYIGEGIGTADISGMIINSILTGISGDVSKFSLIFTLALSSVTTFTTGAVANFRVMKAGIFTEVSSMTSTLDFFKRAIDDLADAIKKMVDQFWAARAAVQSGNPIAMTAATGSPPGRAMGGYIEPNKIYEFNEQRMGVPFEIFQTNGRNYILSSQKGYMHSPIAQQGGSGMSGGQSIVYQDNSVIQINGSGLSREELTQAIIQAKRDEAFNNPFNLRMKKAGV